MAVRLTNLNVMEILLFTWYTSVGGIMVSIAAFQAVDPGSIPGRRMFFLNSHSYRETASTAKKLLLHAVTRIRTWVTAATTQGPNH